MCFGRRFPPVAEVYIGKSFVFAHINLSGRQVRIRQPDL
jgi:hypothetical protein